MGFVINFFLFFLAIFLILLVLIQRGRGGGLAGAFGGLGGQSAFGTKAGDLFTRITIVVAAVWIVLCIFSVWYFGAAAEHLKIEANPASAEEAASWPGTGPEAPSGAPSPAQQPSEKPAP